MFSTYPEYDSYAPTDYDDDPQYIHIDEHQEALDNLQNIIDRAKEELVNLKKAIATGNIEMIEAAAEEVYGYLED